MSSDDVVERGELLEECLGYIESCILNRCIGKVSASKKDCLSAIKVLNVLSKSDDVKKCIRVKDVIKTLSQYTLSYYEKIDKETLTLSQKLEWISSNLPDSQFHPPIIQFSPTLSSADPIFVSKKNFIDNDITLQKTPTSMVTQFKSVDSIQWTTTDDDLSNLFQDLLANCSFVSSLLSIVDFKCRVHPMNELIQPHDSSSKYKVKLTFNGSTRLVSIDNRLPFTGVNRKLFISSYSDSELYWPALIEKAYLKIMGNGYVFSGSNKAIDTYVLCGWLPEIIPIRNGRVPEELPSLWNLYLKGEVLLGIGTGNLSDELASQLNLISDHDYALHTFNKDGSLVLKNPWIEKGDKQNRFITIDEYSHLRYLYVNWKKTFQCTTKINFIYPKSVKYIFDKSQYSLSNTSKTEEEVWLLLERHLQFKEKSILISVSVFESEIGDRVLAPNQYRCVNALANETNNRLELVKFVMQPNSRYTVVISSSEGSTFTLSCYSNVEVNISKAKFLNPYSLPVEKGQWNMINSGGNWAISTFIKNPQYCIKINEVTDLQIGLFSSSAKSVINFHVFHSDKHIKDLPVRTFDKTKLLFNEKYNEGFQVHNYKNVQPGYLKVVLSTYDYGHHDEYNLIVNYGGSNQDNVTITKLSNSIGLFTDKRSYDWQNSNRFKLNFVVDSFDSKMTFHIQHLNSLKDHDLLANYRPAIRGSIFNARTQRPVQINEVWKESLYGVYVDGLIEQPGEYILLVERFEQGQGRCVVEVGSNKRFTLK
ncbi:uncharacterized protein RJT20DRAFT_93983 [Scheffersomyces xylosifermentans]|uniref:uncharacterized protein n=1 Tax=Scheffersomyces xylosifermentans TaxID=1304137 RepID=UPI00315D064A